MKVISQYIFKIVLIIIVMQFFMIKTSQASYLGDIFQAGEEFLTTGRAEESPINSDEMRNDISNIYNVLLALGIVLAVIIGAVLGIKLMFAGIEEKAKVKEMMIPYVAGCVIIFGAFGIWKLVISLLGGIA